MKSEGSKPLRQIVPFKIDVNGLFSLLTFHRLGVETGRHTYTRPQSIAPVHENKTHRWLVGSRGQARRIHQGQSTGTHQGLFKKISAVIDHVAILFTIHK